MEIHEARTVYPHELLAKSSITPFELRITSPSGARRRQPISWTKMRFGNSVREVADILLPDPALSAREGSLLYVNGGLFVSGLGTGGRVARNGESVRVSELQPGDELVVGGWSLCLGETTREPLAFLEGLTQPHRGWLWPLGVEGICIGRCGGERENGAELDDPTVSRAHARVGWHDGVFRLQPETRRGVTHRNGEMVDRDLLLQDGDLLGIGDQLVRFQTLKSPVAASHGTLLFCNLRQPEDARWGDSLARAARQVHELTGVLRMVVEAHGGQILRLLGEAMVATFTGPQQARQAVACAETLQHAVEELCGNWAQRGLPGVAPHVGLGTGEVAAGGTGKWDLAALASLGPILRLEEEARKRGDFLLLGRGTADLLDKKSARLESLGWLGDRHPVEAFRPARKRASVSFPTADESGLFPFLEPQERDELRQMADSRVLERGELLFSQGQPADALFLVLEGSLALQILSESERQVTLAYRGPGQMVGETAFLEGEPYFASCSVAAPGRCLVLQTSDWAAFLERHPGVYRRAVEARLPKKGVRLRDLGLTHLGQRLGAVLARSGQDEGEPRPGGILLPSRLTSHVLSGLLGTDRDSVRRAARERIEEGLLERRGASFLLPDGT